MTLSASGSIAESSSTPQRRVHAFGDDALGTDDAVALAARIRAGEVHPNELHAAAVARAQQVDPTLDAIETPLFDSPRCDGSAGDVFYGVPAVMKDNLAIVGVPTSQGSEAFRATPAKEDAPFATQVLSTGLSIIAKSRLPEFGLNASTEYMTGDPVRNPWLTSHSVGASSGGSAALVAAGVVPVAHANDGGGSIRIPAACAGLVGLKPSRGRHVIGPKMERVPIDIGSEGIVSRSVRDTAAFFCAIEETYHNAALPPIGRIEGPGNRRLRVGLILDSITGSPDADTADAVMRTAAVLEQHGHDVEPIELPVGQEFADDFLQYWAFLAHLLVDLSKVIVARDYDKSKADGLAIGLRNHHRANMGRTRGAIKRLKRVGEAYGAMFATHDLVISPTLRHTAPVLGHLSPTLPFDVLIKRLFDYVAYTPLNNVTGTPAMSVPAGLTADGVPIGVQLLGAYGDERTLIETAYLLEAEQPFATIWQ